VLEGPLCRAPRGSWIVNGRRSYVDLIADQLNTRTTPQYSDVQGKITWTPDAANTLSLVGLAGFDKVTLDDEEDAYSRGFDFVDARQTQYAGGLTWKRLLGVRGHALVTVHRSENNHTYDVRDRRRAGQAPDPVYLADVFEAETGLRARTTLRLRPSTDVTLGGELRRVRFRHWITAAADTAQEAFPTTRTDSVALIVLPRNEVQVRDAGQKGAVFASLEQRLPRNLTATLGLRWDRFDFGGQEDWSPRAGLTWRPSEAWTVRGSTGLFHQTPFAIQLTQTESARRLPMQRAAHAVLGCDRRLGRGTQATVEAYIKQYSDLPVAPSRDSHELVPAGSGRVRGVEAFVQQRLLSRWYGLASYALSKSERTDVVHGTFVEAWDARHVLTMLAGVRPRTGWEFSARWRWVSGRPFTDFTERFEVGPNGVRAPGSGFFVGFEAPYNGGRLPAYHRLDLRVDHRRQLGRFHLVTFVDLENVYDRDNILLQRFSHASAAPEAVYQWKLLPVGGLSLEF
jgi:outer membrane receptor protein involved in Fe transport